MLLYPELNPVIVQIGPLAVHWYGVMYLVGFLLAWGLALKRRQAYAPPWSSESIADLIFYAALGVVLGGRLGYMLFYAFPDWVQNPMELFKVWDGGMSFHGGLLGVVFALWLYHRKYRRHWWDLCDFVAPLVPLGLAAGRLGNFINGELWGRVTDVPWAMVFPNGGPWPRHPSQLYECFLEGIVLFLIMWWYSHRPRPRFAVSALFLFLYGSFRFFVEFFRQPDPQYGFIAFGWLTMGQTLSIPMVLWGVVALWRVHRKAP